MMMDLCKVLFVETNPVPVKAAMHLIGKMENELRLPLVKLQNQNEEALKAALRGLGLVK